MVAKKRKADDSPFWGCSRFPSCRATHGAHPDGSPLGIPANRETKNARIAAHAAFDPIWEDAAKVYDGQKACRKERSVRFLKGMARTRCYVWLAAQLGLTVEDTHMGMFDKETCERVVAVCQGVEYAQVREWWKTTIEERK